ncbi:hypothetical protein GDO81_004748 [Engystomops pustulosus]|uniref:Uncharacterized protein n=1 Tax=Engystomops pustulosus TaxID=76066 RepID=A0AAV7CID1_ENGPU|nr:hypothetical protein GDO81_004748 [Engystomops pustulosus]
MTQSWWYNQDRGVGPVVMDRIGSETMDANISNHKVQQMWMYIRICQLLKDVQETPEDRGDLQVSCKSQQISRAFWNAPASTGLMVIYVWACPKLNGMSVFHIHHRKSFFLQQILYKITLFRPALYWEGGTYIKPKSGFCPTLLYIIMWLSHLKKCAHIWYLYKKKKNLSWNF